MLPLEKPATKQKAVFLDKDGTLITDVPYSVNPQFVRLETGVLEGLLILQSSGYLLVIISNQPGVAMGLFSVEELENLIFYLTDIFLKNEINIAGFYYCPHLPKNKEENHPGCTCRKPLPGLLVKAAEDLNIDLGQSWMIGDILNDTEAGKRAGCRSVLINNGNETEWELNSVRKPDYTAINFLDASKHIFEKTMIKNA